MGCSPVSLEKNKNLVRRFVAEVRNAGNLAVLDELVVPEKVAEFRATGALLHAAFANYRVEINELIAEGNRVVLRATQHGIHIGEFLGIPATGRSVTWSVIRVFAIENGQFTDTWAGSDHAGLLRQLGAVITVPASVPTVSRPQ